MNWGAWLWSGLKGIVYYVIATVVTVLIGAIGVALGYQPNGQAAILVWQIVTACLIGIQGWLKNWLQHKDDKVVVQ
jgi:hypothetical protein